MGIGHRTVFGGLRLRERHIVVLLLGDFKSGEQYFIEGMHFPGLLTRFSPFVTLVPCGHSSVLRDSIEIRLLHDGLPRGRVRTIGRVRSFLDRSGLGVPNIKVAIKGPGGSATTRTDARGIYDCSGLPPGRYRIGIAPPNPTQSHCRRAEKSNQGRLGAVRYTSPRLTNSRCRPAIHSSPRVMWAMASRWSKA